MQAFPPGATKPHDAAKAILQMLENKMASSSQPFLGGATPSRLDVALAAINYPWVLYTGEHRALFSAGQSGGIWHNTPDVPHILNTSLEYGKQFPAVHSNCLRMYEQHRTPVGS
jgi:glutathione S-transferase